MYNFALPKWNKHISIKTVNIVVTVFYILSIIPMLAIGHFDWLSADDLAQGGPMIKYYESTGNVFATFIMAFYYAFDFYLRWEGTFFPCLMYRFNPCVLGERMYFLVVYVMIAILTFGVCYFFRTLIVHVFKGDKKLANIISMLTLIIMIHSLPANGPRVEMFYWYTGAVDYTFMLGMGLFWIGLLIRAVLCDDKKSRVRKLCWACFWGFWLGGANYLTALSLAVISFLIIVLIVLEKVSFIKLENVDVERKKIFNLLWLPALFNFIGLLASVLCPGNASRAGQTQGFGPIKSIIIAFYYVFEVCINALTRWEVLVLLAIVAIIMWKLAGTLNHRFEHPFIFSIFALGMMAVVIVPPLFALSNVDAGRLRGYIFMNFVLMMVLELMYMLAWGRQKIEGEIYSVRVPEDKDSFAQVGSTVIALLTMILVFGSALCVKADPYYYSWSSAFTDVVNGNAKTFYNENVERLAVLKDDSVKDVVLKPYSVRPEIIAFDDATSDPNEWINYYLAKYYEKNSVVVKSE